MARVAKILILYHSAYGHVETLAYAVATGAQAARRALCCSGLLSSIRASWAKAAG